VLLKKIEEQEARAPELEPVAEEEIHEEARTA
jgi:hypothetical protein